SLSGFAPMGGWLAKLTPYFLNEENVEPHILKRALANVPAPILGGVGRQFARWYSHGTFDSMDGSLDYRKAMATLKAPVLLIAGAKDRLAPVESVMAGQ